MSASAVLSVEDLQPGMAGLEQTRERLQEQIDAGARHWLTIRRAEELTARVPPWDEEGQLRELFNYFIGAHGFPYRKDPVDVQVVEGAPARPAGGDCKRYTVQLGAYVQALGFPVEVVIVGQRAPAPGRHPRFHHVYIRAQLSNGRQVTLDPTLHRPTHGYYAEAGDELGHAIERTYPMMGFAATNQLGDFDLFAAIGNAARSIGYALDPTRQGSPIRGLIQSVPGVGPAVVAGADVLAAARKALASGEPAPEPATTLTLTPVPEPAGVALPSSPPPSFDATITRLAQDLQRSTGTSAAVPTAPVQEQPKEDKKGISAGAVVGGVAVATTVIGGLIYAAVRSKKKR